MLSQVIMILEFSELKDGAPKEKKGIRVLDSSVYYSGFSTEQAKNYCIPQD